MRAYVYGPDLGAGSLAGPRCILINSPIPGTAFEWPCGIPVPGTYIVRLYTDNENMYFDNVNTYSLTVFFD